VVGKTPPHNEAGAPAKRFTLVHLRGNYGGSLCVLPRRLRGTAFVCPPAFMYDLRISLRLIMRILFDGDFGGDLRRQSVRPKFISFDQ
jgi:hypothetical protein